MARRSWHDDFLRVLEGTGDVDLAAAAAGIKPGTAKNRRSTDPDFAVRWETAIGNAPAGETKREGAGDWIDSFLRVFRASGNASAAARAAKVSRKTVYEWRDEDADFRADFEHAREQAVEMLELIARQRALGGSDRLLEFLLKAHKPEVYGDRLRIMRDIDKEAEALRERALAEGLSPEDAQRAVEEFEAILARRGQ